MSKDNDQVARIRQKLSALRENVERRSLMYGGNLTGVESVWNMLCAFEAIIDGDIDDCHDKAYRAIAEKYRCGNWTLSGKVEHEMCKEGFATREAADELIRRLHEVDVLRKEMRSVIP